MLVWHEMSSTRVVRRGISGGSYSSGLAKEPLIALMLYCEGQALRRMSCGVACPAGGIYSLKRPADLNAGTVAEHCMQVA